MRHDDVMARFAEQASYLVFQKELGENGTPHYQGYVFFHNAVRMNTLKRILPRAHWEVAHGTPQENTRYCTKESGRIEGPWTSGTEPHKGKRNDLSAAIDTIKTEGFGKMIDDHPDVFVRYSAGLMRYNMAIERSKGGEHHNPKEVVLLVGPPRCGKSRWARAQIPEGEEYYLHTNTQWFDNYIGQEWAIFDDYGAGSALSLDTLLKITDVYDDYPVPVKGGFMYWKPKHIIVTSNLHPRHWYNWDNRMILRKALGARFTKLIVWEHEGPVVCEDPADIAEWFDKELVTDQ